jgi:hypothetical protein
MRWITGAIGAVAVASSTAWLAYLLWLLWWRATCTPAYENCYWSTALLQLWLLYGLLFVPIGLAGGIVLRHLWRIRPRPV